MSIYMTDSGDGEARGIGGLGVNGVMIDGENVVVL
jgi:hypothetical protein